MENYFCLTLCRLFFCSFSRVRNNDNDDSTQMMFLLDEFFFALWYKGDLLKEGHYENEAEKC